MRELYSLAVTRDITKTAEYKECFLLLGFQSKEELSAKLKKIINYLRIKVHDGGRKKTEAFVDKLVEFLDLMNNFNMEEMDDAVKEIESEESIVEENMDRKKFKQVFIFAGLI